MPKRTTFTLEEDEYIREARGEKKTWVAIGRELNRLPETCRLHWRNVVSQKASYKEALELREKGFRAAEVARRLDMRPQTVMWWFRRANEQDPRRPRFQKRTCLTCRQPFNSEGSHNRVCGPCKNSAAWREGDLAAPFRYGSR